MAVRLFLDTAERDVAVDLLGTGLFEGLTTNPTILQRAGLGVAAAADVHRWAVDAGAREVFFQSWGREVDVLVERGLRLRELGDEVVVKLVASREGTAACAQLAARGVRTLLTAVHAPGQAVLAAAAGATYVAPYLGRLDAAGRDGHAEVVTMHELLRATGSTTEVLVASLRDVASVVRLARAGVGAFTVAPAVAEAFFTEQLTATAVTAFEDAVAATS